MKEELNKIMDKNMSKEDLDFILGKSIQAKFDAELRLDLEKSLRQDYQLSKGIVSADFNNKKRSRRIYYITAIAASLTLLILALNHFLYPSENVRVLAYSYLDSSEIYHSGAVKGYINDPDIRTQAIRAFNAQEYVEAEQYFSLIKEKTEEDIFYIGISALYNKKYEESIAKLALIARTESNFKAEANWYLAISYILKGEEETAKELLLEMESSSWNYDKTQQLLKALK